MTKKHNIFNFVSPLLVAGLSGCSGVASFDAPVDANGRPTVAQIVDRVQCEIVDAIHLYNEKTRNSLHQAGAEELSKWAASVELDLTVNDTGGISPSSGLALSFLQPLKQAGSFALGGTIIANQTRQRIFQQKYDIALSALGKAKGCAELETVWHNYNLEGDLGIAEVVGTGLGAFDDDDKVLASKATNTISTTISFDVFLGATNFGPIWSLRYFKNGPGLGFNFDHQHKLIISFAPTPYPPPPKNATTPTGKGGKPPTASMSVMSARDRAAAATSAMSITSTLQSLQQSLSRQ
jgi:hypothetical protein